MVDLWALLEEIEQEIPPECVDWLCDLLPVDPVPEHIPADEIMSALLTLYCIKPRVNPSLTRLAWRYGECPLWEHTEGERPPIAARGHKPESQPLLPHGRRKK